MRSRAFLVAAAALFVLGCGASDDSGGDGPSSEPVTVVYAGSKWYGHAPVWIGIRKGIFARHGFEVEDRAFGGSAERLNALETGNATFASLGEVAMLEAMTAGRRGFYWVGSQNVAPGNEGLVAIGIDSIADLRGKRIALYDNTSVHLTIALLLKDAGLDIRKDVTIVNGRDSEVVELVRNGDADAGGIWEPFYTDLRNLPEARVLGTDKDTSIYREFKSMTGPDVICAAKEWVDADEDRAKRFFRAYFEAVQWCQDHPEELIEVAMEVTRKDRESVAAALANFTWIGWDGQKVMMSDARMFGQADAVAALLIELGKIEAAPAYRDWTRVNWYFDE